MTDLSASIMNMFNIKVLYTQNELQYVEDDVSFVFNRNPSYYLVRYLGKWSRMELNLEVHFAIAIRPNY